MKPLPSQLSYASRLTTRGAMIQKIGLYSNAAWSEYGKKSLNSQRRATNYIQNDDILRTEGTKFYKF